MNKIKDIFKEEKEKWDKEDNKYYQKKIKEEIEYMKKRFFQKQFKERKICRGIIYGYLLEGYNLEELVYPIKPKKKRLNKVLTTTGISNQAKRMIIEKKRGLN